MSQASTCLSRDGLGASRGSSCNHAGRRHQSPAGSASPGRPGCCGTSSVCTTTLHLLPCRPAQTASPRLHSHYSDPRWSSVCEPGYLTGYAPADRIRANVLLDIVYAESRRAGDRRFPGVNPAALAGRCTPFARTRQLTPQASEGACSRCAGSRRSRLFHFAARRLRHRRDLTCFRHGE